MVRLTAVIYYTAVVHFTAVVYSKVVVYFTAASKMCFTAVGLFTSYFTAATQGYWNTGKACAE